MRATIVPSLIICPKCGMVLTWNKPLPWETRRPLSLELECSYNYDGIPKGCGAKFTMSLPTWDVVPNDPEVKP